MKTIGLLGGMSWESTVEYYRLINEMVKARLGGLHSARCLLYSVNFAEIETLQHQGRWDEAGLVLADAAERLERGGADFMILCTNTMHKVAGAIQARLQIPFLHIADPAGEAIKGQGLKTVGLLGTGFTMEQDFYRGRLVDRYGLQVLTPDKTDREVIHRVIYDELCLGIVKPGSKERYLQIIERLVEAGAEGIILGCTEIGLLVHDDDCTTPLFDTTRLHAAAAVDYALSEKY